MKRILSLLLCYVFLHVQAFAISGGPTNAGTLNLVGTYAGIMTPILNPSSEDALLALDENSIGLFGIQVKDLGLADGVCAIFNKGEIFTGKMIGVGDPKGKITMVFEARTI